MKSIEINSNQIFIGNVKKCTYYSTVPCFSNATYLEDQCVSSDCLGYILEESEIYKENVILIKMKGGRYVDLEEYRSLFDDRKIYLNIAKNKHYVGDLVLTTSAYCLGSLFVDENSLKPYYKEKEQEEILSIRKLKQKVKTKVNHKTV